MPRLLKPTRENRLESVQYLLKQLAVEDSREKDLLEETSSFDERVEGRRLSAVIGVIEGLALQAEIEAGLSRLKGDSQQLQKFARAFAYRYWGVELNLNERKFVSNSGSPRDDTMLEILTCQGLSLACGLTWFADWTAPYLANLLKTSEAQDYFAFLEDRPAHLFFSILQKVLVTGKWPSFDPEETKQAGAFGLILQNASDPTSFRDALTDYCDYRVAQCFGYAGIDAEKRRRPSQLRSIFDTMTWEKVFPFELFIVQYAYQKATGKKLSLESNHPLMRTVMMSEPFPKLEPLYADEMTQKMQAFGQKSFGAQWKLREPIAMK